MVRHVASVFFISAAVACGGSSGPDGGSQPTACGLTGMAEGTECASAVECGAGVSNFKEVLFCSNCPHRVDTHTCESGRCVEHPVGKSGNVDFAFSPPAGSEGAQSFVVATFAPVAADGTRVTCAALVSTCALLANPVLPIGNSTMVQLNPPADPTLAYRGRTFDYVGSDRLLLIQITTARQGSGNVVGIGCVDGITVTEGEVAGPVEVILSPVPAT